MTEARGAKAQDHPRVSGEHTLGLLDYSHNMGLSPRERGARQANDL